MTSARSHRPVGRAFGAFAALLAMAGAAQADGPGDARERAARRGGAFFAKTVGPEHRPARRVTGGPGYVGSDWGLGKPSFSGIGTRPDWGLSGE